jgi:thermitase
MNSRNWIRTRSFRKPSALRLVLQTLEDRTVPSAAAEFVPGEILVGLDDRYVAAPLAPGAAGLLEAARIQFASHGLHTPKVLFELPSQAGNVGRLVTKWSVSPLADIPALAARLARQPGIAYAEPNAIVRAASVDDASFTASPDSDWGSRFGLQEHLIGVTVDGTPTRHISAVDAWNVSGVNHGAGIRVAVLDSGIDLDHPDLLANLARNPDGSVLGANFVTPGASVQDDHGHGTHVSGIIAAALNNTGDRALGTDDPSWNGGVVGVAPRAEIMPVKMLDHNGTANLSWYAQSLEWAVANGARIVNMSLGRIGYFQTIHDAVALAYQSNVLVVAAAHNQNHSQPMYPGAHPMALGVAAVDKYDVKASFSNYGGWVDVTAPGVGILSTLIDSPGSAADGYARWNGTSMATPMVAGVAALVLAQNPSWTPAQVAAQIVGTADYIYGVPGNENHFNLLGSGRVNAYQAITRTLGRPQVVSTPDVIDRFSLTDPILIRFSQGMSPDIDALSDGEPANFEIRRDADGDGIFAASERVPVAFYDYDGTGGMPADYVLGPTLGLTLGELNTGDYQLIIKEVRMA